MSEAQKGLLFSYQLESATGPFEWHHLQSDLPQSREWMQNHGLHPGVIEALTARETRPRSMAFAGGTLLVVRGVNTNAGQDPEDMISLRIWFDQNRIISARRQNRPLMSVYDLSRTIDAGDPPESIPALLLQLVNGMSDRISSVIDSIDDQLSPLEEDNGHTLAIRRAELVEWRRQIAAIRRFIAPQRDALTAFAMQMSSIAPDQQHAFQQVAERMIRFVDELDFARERALVLQEQLNGEVAEEQNKRMYVLSLVAAVFLPLSFVTGLFGMNVAGLPGTADPSAFLYVCLGMLASAAFSFLFFWWRKWY